MTRIERLASLLLAARRSAVLVDPSREPGPANQDEAHRVQDLVLRGLGDGRPGAWKAIPPRAGSAPAASPVPAQCVTSSPAVLSVGDELLGVEAEVAFRLGADLEPQEALVAIELCETRLQDWKNAPALWKLADFQSNRALVLGTGTRKSQGIEFAAQPVEVFVSERRVATATGGHPSGDPARLLPWMREHCARRGGLQPGDVVTTGSWVGIMPAQAGDEILARFAGIGECRLRLERR